MLYASGINSILISDIQKQTYHLTTNKLKQHFMIKQLFSLVVVAFSTLNLNAQNIIFYDNFENGLKNDWTLSSTLSNGVAIESVSAMIGHKRIATTQHYAKMVDKKLEEDMKRLAQRLG